ncbi:MAG TPA: FliI/YscN family ATPase [Bryobacteraceae bacterium]|nr:FliI/YscN family ATPase [Bryobacteraceae bacterium]
MFADYIETLPRLETLCSSGHVRELTGLLVSSDGPAAAMGDFCDIRSRAGKIARAQVVGFRDGRVLLMPLEDTGGLQQGDLVVARPQAARLEVGDHLLGRVLDGFGRPMDSLDEISSTASYDLYAAAPSPLEREHITEPLVTGVRAIDSLLPIGKGQRIGIFGGSGVGKSILLGAMARHNSADVSVIALIGERNREVREFLEKELSAEGLKRSVVVVATSDMPAPLRIRAAFVALAVSEYFRDQGKSVLLVMDSVTRLAMAQREIGLAAGEPPGPKGYPPSVFHLLPKIFERAGNFQKGSITGFFTVLVEGDDFNEPVCDAVRAILDGHIVLSRELGARGHYPAIDVLNSVSRLANRIATPEQQGAARKLRETLAEYERSEDLINLGAYVNGSNARLDSAIKIRPKLLEFLRQDANYSEPIDETNSKLLALASQS